MPKQKLRDVRKPKRTKPTGAFWVYSPRRAAQFYQHPLQFMREGLSLINWKNSQNHIDDLVRFRDEVKEKIREVRTGRKNKKQRSKKPISESGKMFTAFRAWSRKHGVPYSREFYHDVWIPCYRRNVLPVWEDASTHLTLPGAQSVSSAS